MSTAAPNSEPVHVGNVPLPTPEQLPDDPDILKAMILELLTTLRQERQDKDALRHRLDALLRRLYGPRAERYDPNQGLLFDDPKPDEQTAAQPTPQPEDKTPRRARPHGRRTLPANLPRKPVHHELDQAARVCLCGQARIDIGADVSEQLDYQPASVFVWQHFVHKYLCPHCAKKNQAAAGETAAAQPVSVATIAPTETLSVLSTGASVIAAAKPLMPIAKGLPGPGLLAYLIVGKYTDHLPLNRQERILARHGVELTRSTLCDWMAACAQLLRPLYDVMVSLVLQSQWLHTDDTLIKNLDHAPGTTDKARFWGYLGDRLHPYNVFDFTLNRQRDGPATFLKDYRGYLHADAFSGYDRLYLPSAQGSVSSIIEVACNAHARRKFYDARTSDDARSCQALGYYRELYELERRAKSTGLDDQARWRLRQDFAVPVLEKFHEWLEEEKKNVLPKSPMGEAFGYAQNNWTALCRYTEAGFLEIDNNISEREMKRIAIGRKNWLFVGSAKGGCTAMVLMSFTSSCHRLGVEPWAYLQDVLSRMPTTSKDSLGELLPDRWQAARSASTASSPPAPAASGTTNPSI